MKYETNRILKLLKEFGPLHVTEITKRLGNDYSSTACLLSAKSNRCLFRKLGRGIWGIKLGESLLKCPHCNGSGRIRLSR